MDFLLKLLLFVGAGVEGWVVVSVDFLLEIESSGFADGVWMLVDFSYAEFFIWSLLMLSLLL